MLSNLFVVDQSIYTNDCGPAICCIVHTILASYCSPTHGEKFILYLRDKPTVGSELFSGLNRRCYIFRVQFRKLCHTIGIWKHPSIKCSTTPVMKQPQNTRVVENDYNPGSDDSSICADDDSSTSSSTYYDSEGEEALERNKEKADENSKYTLKAGTNITFTPTSVFARNEEITVTITEIKTDWANPNVEYPINVVTRDLVMRTSFLNTKDKKYSFTLNDINMEPGTFEVEKEDTNHPKYGKFVTNDQMDTISDHFFGTYPNLPDANQPDFAESNYQCSQKNLEKPCRIESRNNYDHDNNDIVTLTPPKKQRAFIVPNVTKVDLHQMVQLNQVMNYEPLLDKFWKDNLDEEYSIITGIMVDMKDARSLLEPNPTEYKKDPKNNYSDNDLKCVYSLLNIDSF